MGLCIRAAALRAVFVTGAVSGGPAMAETILDRAKDGDPSFIYKQYHHLAQPSGNDPAWYNFDHTFAWGLSVDGTYVAGESTADCPSDSIDDSRSGCTRAAVWAPDFGSGSGVDEPFILPTLPLGNGPTWYRSQARAIDDNGETIVGQEEVLYGDDPEQWRAVAWSRAPGQSWQTGAQATELTPSGVYDAAGARGISGNGQYAVGWLGITADFPRSGTEAALWRRTGPVGWTTAEPLGHLDDDNNSSANGVAIDADGKPVVVGWSGGNEAIQGYVFRQGSDPGSDFIPGSSVSRVFCSDCQTRPFVWTEVTGMQGLELLDDDTKGDATAISADAKTIVGWSGWFASDADKGSEAVRWVNSGGDDWSAVQPQGLGVFSLPSQFDSAAPDARPMGSVALAVSETGQAIVGYQTFGVGSERGLSARFNLAFIWTEALGTGHYLGDVLTEAGVALGDWVLYTATGVRETNEFFVVVGDGCQGSAEDCLQAFDPPGFIARIGRDADSPSGITTPTEQMISFTELSTAAIAIGTNVGNTLTGLNDMAENHRCIRPEDGLPTGWCFFTFGTATLFNGDGTTSGDHFSGDVGLAHYFTPVTSAGASIGGGVVDTDLHWDGSYRANDLHVGGYLAHIPDTGLRLFGAGVWGDISDVDLTRGYLNGTGMAYSSGDTEGDGWGLLGRIGYGFRAGDHLLTPFAELSFTEASLGGYREAGGPFPTTFQDVETNTTTGRLGILEEADISPTVRVFGSAAWAHVLDEETPIVRGAVLDIFDLSTQGSAGITDWAEFMSGARYQLSQQGVLSAIGRVSTEFDDFFAMQGRLAYSHTF